ncbi:unnamed protein product [Peniophora sp. CBMAI 1063]|nr:unnamed protein product [Peniophora sp. CBMAI 1063]
MCKASITHFLCLRASTDGLVGIKSARVSEKKRCPPFRLANLVKCDGKQAATGRCTNCNTHDWDCVYNSTLSLRYDAGYIRALEVKVKKLEGLIKRLLPDQDFTSEIGFELTRDNWMLPGVCGSHALNDAQPHTSKIPLADVMPAFSTSTSGSLAILGPEQAPPTTPLPEDDHSEDEVNSLTTKLQSLPALDAAPPRASVNYLGKSSRAGLLNTVLALCAKLAPSADTTAASRTLDKQPLWLKDPAYGDPPPPFQFPEQDLLNQLLQIYFVNVHMFAPVLHRPTFESDVKSGLHLRGRAFGSVVLLGEDNWHSAGWRYFMQVRLHSDALFSSSSSHLHRLQAICLGVMYSIGFSSLHASLHATMGIRLALDIGAHKRSAYGVKLSAEDELFKRVFWTLVFFDRTLSGSMGRPSSIQEEDFDLELPLCCDDEYLDPQHGGKQPKGKSSTVSYFIWMIKLSQIQGLALRTIYASTKARAHYKFQGEEWTTRTIAQLDSLLNSWANTVPEHLRWDPDRTDDVFFCQSAHLWMQYHEMRIMVHRQFISSPQTTPLPFPALAMCTSAAHSLAHLIAALYTRLPNCTGILHWGAGYAGLVLLIGIGNARLHNLVYDRKSAMADIETMLAIFRLQENRWRWAGRYARMLQTLKVIGEKTSYEPVESRKRRLEEDPDVPQKTRSNFDPSLSKEDRHSQGASGSADWSEPSVFGPAPISQSPAGGSRPLDASLSSSTGIVLGNVDFGALFGFEVADGMDVHLHPSTRLDSEMDTFGSLATGPVGMTQPGDWPAMPLDVGMDDWQWMLPGQSAYGGYQTFTREQQHR